MAADTNFDKVTLLMPMSGANAGTAFTDYSAGANLVIPGSITTSTALSKYYGSSGVFSAGFLTISDNPSVNLGAGDYTIECWFRKNSTQSTAWPNLISKGAYQTGSGRFGIYFQHSSGNLYFEETSPVAHTLLAGVVTDTNWHHFAASRVAGTIYTFLDGVAGLTATTINNVTCTFPLYIGQATGGDYFGGNINDLRITKGLGRYTTGFTPPTQLCGTVSGVVTDAGGANAVRTVIGMARLAPKAVQSVVSTTGTGAYSLTLPITEHSIIALDSATNDPVLDDVIIRTTPT